MHVIILHQTVECDASHDERDVLVQVTAVAEALRRIGHDVRIVTCGLDLQSLRRRLTSGPTGGVFYLVESLAGSDALAHLPACLLEHLAFPHTGAPASALMISQQKLLTKDVLRRAGLPTPFWYANGTPAPEQNLDETDSFSGRFLIKATNEHASIAMADDGVVDVTGAMELSERLGQWSRVHGRACFAERFVAGREFNVSVLATPDGPTVLPLAEIDFSAFPPDKPHIVSYAAKWDKTSFEYHHTPRRFPEFLPGDTLAERLKDLAVRCWNVFGLRGYGRVDFRVDPLGNPWIVDVNANPCLSPDAGFVAALAAAGLEFERAIEWILEDMVYVHAVNPAEPVVAVGCDEP